MSLPKNSRGSYLGRHCLLSAKGDAGRQCCATAVDIVSNGHFRLERSHEMMVQDGLGWVARSLVSENH